MGKLVAIECDLSDLPKPLAQAFAAIKSSPCKILLIAIPASTSIGQRKGGAIGGKARAKKLSPERRKEIAKKAARSRWGARPGKP